MPPPFAKDPPRLQVPLTREELTRMETLARQAKTAPEVLGQSAIRRMLDQARAGALPLVPPSNAGTAIEITSGGTPLPVLPPLPGEKPHPHFSRPWMLSPMDMKPERLPVPLTREQLTEIAALARQAKTSPAVLGQVAIRGWLLTA